MVLNKCCCCIDLRVGAMTIAILEIILGLLVFEGNKFWDDWDGKLLAITTVASGTSLLFGAINYDQTTTILNLILSMIGIVLWFIGAIIMLVVTTMVGMRTAVTVTGVFFLVTTLGNLYFWICVYSFLGRMKSGRITTPLQHHTYSITHQHYT